MNEKSYEANTTLSNEGRSVLNVHLWLASTMRRERSRARLCTVQRQKKAEKSRKMKKTKGEEEETMKEEEEERNETERLG